MKNGKDFHFFSQEAIARVINAAEESGVKDNLTLVILFFENFYLNYQKSNLDYFKNCKENASQSSITSYISAGVNVIFYEYKRTKASKGLFSCCLPFFK